MKPIITLAGMILFMLCHGACSTRRLSDLQKSRLRFEEQSEIESRVKEINRINRHESVTDSNRNTYQLTIFPADTFKFSMQNGFIGKASKIVLNGTSEQLIRVLDTSKFTSSISSESDTKMRTDRMENLRDRSTQLERRDVTWIGLCVGLIVAVVVLGVWRRSRFT